MQETKNTPGILGRKGFNAGKQMLMRSLEGQKSENQGSFQE